MTGVLRRGNAVPWDVVYRGRLLFVLLGAVVAACLLAACGSAAPSAPSNPLTAELSYLPPASPLVITITTDPNSTPVKNANALLSKFQLGGLLASAVKQKLQQQGVNYDTDVRPLLGNPAVLGAIDPTLASSDPTLVGVWVTKDADALNTLVQHRSGAHKIGSHDGATLYGFSGGVLATAGTTLVVADTKAQVEAALDRHAGGSGMTQSEYAKEVAGLPTSSLLRVFGNVKASLATPKEAKARLVPWVAALTSYGVSITPNSSGLSLDWRLDTTGRPLTAAQLPLAAGSTAPALATGVPGSFGLRDPAQVAAFIESAVQATNPAGYAKFLSDQAGLRRATGLDLNSLLGLLTGDLITAGQGPTSLVRTGVSDPGKAQQALAQLQRHARSISPSLRMSSVGGGFYLVKTPTLTFNIGVVGNQVVAGNAPVARLRGFASAPTSASGGRGALAFRASLSQALRLTGNLVHSPEALAILNQLGDFTGWLAATPSAVTGDATLGLK